MNEQTPSFENNWFAGFEPEPETDDEDGVDNYTGDDLPIVVRWY